MIVQELAIIVEVEAPSDRFKTLRSLPAAMGGIGALAHRSRREAGALESRARAFAYIKEHMSYLTVVAEREDVWPPICIGEADGLPDVINDLTADEKEGLDDLGNPTKIRSSARKMVKHVDERMFYDLARNLLADDSLRGENSVAFLRSCQSKAPGKWLRSFHVFEGKSRQRILPDGGFRGILRARLLEPMRDSAGRTLNNCPCCWNPLNARSLQGVSIGPSHALGYERLQKCHTDRDNAVRDEVASVLKKHLPMTGVTVTKEEFLTAEHGAGAASTKMDIIVRADGGYIRYIDVAIVEPSGVRAVELGSWEEQLRAAQDKADDKLNQYRSSAPLLDQSKLVPFVLESSGRPGKRAKQFLVDSGLPGAIVRMLYERTSVLLAHYGGMMITDVGRKRRGVAGG